MIQSDPTRLYGLGKCSKRLCLARPNAITKTSGQTTRVNGTTTLLGPKFQCLKPQFHKRCIDRTTGVLPAAVGGTADAFPAEAEQPQLTPAQGAWKSFWTFTGILAMLGSVGGALAALLGYLNTSYALALPLVLPVVSLIASLQREGLISEVQRQQYDVLSRSLRMDTVGLLGEVKSGVQDVRKALEVQASSTAKLNVMESRLSSLEGALLSSGRNLREVTEKLNALPERLTQMQRGPLEALLQAIRAEISRVLGMKPAQDTAALSSMHTRLASMEGHMARIEVNQGDAVRHLDTTISNSMNQTTLNVQATVRMEVERGMEPVRQLPNMMSATLPGIIAASMPPPMPLAYEQPPPAYQQPPSATNGNTSDQTLRSGHEVATLSPDVMEQLRSMMRQEVQVAMQAMMVELHAKQLAAATPAVVAATSAGNAETFPDSLRLDNDQWEALGRRLTRLETSLDAMPEAASSMVLTQLPSQLHPQAESAAQAAASAVSVTVTQESHKIEQQLQAGFQAIKADLEEVTGLIRPLTGQLQALQQVDSALPQGEEGANKVVVDSTAAAMLTDISNKVVRIAQALDTVEKSMHDFKNLQHTFDQTAAAADTTATAAKQAIEFALDQAKQREAELQIKMQQVQESIAAVEASGKNELGPGMSGEMLDQARAETMQRFEQQLEGLRNLSNQVNELQNSMEALLQKNDAIQETLTTQQMEIERTLQERQSAVANTMLLDASTTNLGFESAAPANVFSEGLLSRDDTSSSSSVDDAATTRSASVVAESMIPPNQPPANVFAEGLLSREESPDPVTSANAPAVTDKPPAYAFNEGMLSREDSPDTSAVPNAPPAYSFSEGMLSREETPDAGNAPGNAATQQGRPANVFLEGVLSREDSPDPSAAAGSSSAAYQFSEGMLSREDTPQSTPAAATADVAASYTSQPVRSKSSSPQDLVYEQLAMRDQQQRQQQASGVQAGSYGAEATPAAEARPSSSPAVNFAPADLSGLKDQQLVAEGLRLLRAGREEASKAQDWALADSLLQDALRVFSYALELAPTDTRALGNCGNVLLAQGELKQQYLSALQSGPVPDMPQELAVQRQAEASLRSEALALLTRAGEMFKAVLEQEGWSSRALVNWGRAMVQRAELVGPSDRDNQARLYRAALDKFEAVLEEEPGMVAARYRSALAMQGLSKCYAPSSRESITLLMDACNYLSDLLSDQSQEAVSLKASVSAALAQAQADLTRARNMRG